MDWYSSNYFWSIKEAIPGLLLLLSADKVIIHSLACSYERQIGSFVREAISSEGSAG